MVPRDGEGTAGHVGVDLRGRTRKVNFTLQAASLIDLELVSELEEISGNVRRGCPGECRPASINSMNEAGTGEQTAAEPSGTDIMGLQ